MAVAQTKWTPSRTVVERSNIHALMQRRGCTSYAELHRWSVQDRVGFWQTMVDRLGVRFDTPPTEVVSLDNGIESPTWFPGATMNIARSCFQAPAEQTAMVYEAERGSLHTMTYGELNALSNRVAHSLKESGFHPGDAIAIDMLMTAEAVAIYLGIIKAGCVVIGIADSFAPEEISVRLRIGDAKGIFTQDVIRRGGKTFPMFDKVAAADAPRAIVVPSNGQADIALRPGDAWWNDFLCDQDTDIFVPGTPGDTTNILFSSGTTGTPKAIPWTHTTPIKSAVDGHLHHDIHEGDVVAWPTSLGWMMGPWLIYAAFMNRASIALYYGNTTTQDFCEFVQRAQVTMLGVVPSLVKAWRTNHATDGVDWSAIKVFSSTGECSNQSDMAFLMETAGGKPVIEYCGGTEIGGGYLTGTVVQPASPATFTTPALGLDLVILDENHQPTANGEVFIVPPSIGLSTRLLNADHREIYFADTPRGPGGETLRRHGDQIERLADGNFRAHGRADDTMNLGGIKVSSADIERVVNTVEGVSETAAIAVAPIDGGPSQLVIYAVLLEESDKAALQRTMQLAIKTKLNPLFKITTLVTIDALPRTASGKVMRRSLRAQFLKERGE